MSLFTRDVRTVKQVCGCCDHEDQSRCQSVEFITEASKRLPKVESVDSENYNQSGALYGVTVELEHRCRRRHDYGLDRETSSFKVTCYIKSHIYHDAFRNECPYFS